MEMLCVLLGIIIGWLIRGHLNKIESSVSELRKFAVLSEPWQMTQQRQAHEMSIFKPGSDGQSKDEKEPEYGGLDPVSRAEAEAIAEYDRTHPVAGGVV